MGSITPVARVRDRGRIFIKTQKEVALMMKASELSALALKHAEELIAPGITTWDIDKSIGNFIRRKGGTPSFYGLYGFPGNACISINRELIHGIPSKKRYIREGDIVSIDIGAFKDGYHGDNSATFACGAVPERTLRFMQVGRTALQKAIEQCRAGKRIGDISNAIQTCVQSAGYHLPEDYIGHGIGRDIHEDPDVPNTGVAGRGPRLTPGMTLAIEPMLGETTDKTKVLKDNWTVVEANGNLSVHYEHTVLITAGEPIVMTELG